MEQATRQRLAERARGAVLGVRRARRPDRPVRRDKVVSTVSGIRRRRPRDVPACARLLRVVFSEHQYPVRFPDAPRGWLTDPDVLDAWVAERQGEILGHVAVSRIGPDARSRLRWREITGREPDELAAVSRLYVRFRVRGEGIGAALLEVALDDIRRRGRIPVLEVDSPSSDAIRLVEWRGWQLLAEDAAERGLWHRFYVAPPPGS